MGVCTWDPRPRVQRGTTAFSGAGWPGLSSLSNLDLQPRAPSSEAQKHSAGRFEALVSGRSQGGPDPPGSAGNVPEVHGKQPQGRERAPDLRVLMLTNRLQVFSLCTARGPPWLGPTAPRAPGLGAAVSLPGADLAQIPEPLPGGPPWDTGSGPAGRRGPRGQTLTSTAQVWRRQRLSEGS